MKPKHYLSWAALALLAALFCAFMAGHALYQLGRHDQSEYMRDAYPCIENTTNGH